MELVNTAGHRENVGHRLIPAADSARLYAKLHQQVAEASPDVLTGERDLIGLFVRMVQDQGDQGIASVRRLCADDRVLVALLRSGLGEQRAQSLGDYAVRRRPSLPWELIEERLGTDQVGDRVRQAGARADRSSLDERSLLALETAVRYVAGELSNKDQDL